jgi:hypothetical protein
MGRGEYHRRGPMGTREAIGWLARHPVDPNPPPGVGIKDGRGYGPYGTGYWLAPDGSEVPLGPHGEVLTVEYDFQPNAAGTYMPPLPPRRTIATHGRVLHQFDPRLPGGHVGMTVIDPRVADVDAITLPPPPPPPPPTPGVGAVMGRGEYAAHTMEWRRGRDAPFRSPNGQWISGDADVGSIVTQQGWADKVRQAKDDIAAAAEGNVKVKLAIAAVAGVAAVGLLITLARMADP